MIKQSSITKSWKTTLAGILQFFAVVIDQVLKLFDADPSTMPEWGLIVTSAIVLYGLLTARDSDVSSEQAGLKESKAILPRSDVDRPK